MKIYPLTDTSRVRSSISERNKRLVLSEVLLRGPLPRTVIAERIGLTQASVSRITRNLINAGLVEESKQIKVENRPGRRRIGVQARADGGYVAGIAINAFKQEVVISNISNEEIATKPLKFHNLFHSKDVLETCANELDLLIEESGINRERLFGCGVVITGAMDILRNRLHYSPILGWKDVNVGQITSRLLNLPIALESIPNAKNLAAHSFGDARSISNAVLLNCSLAIGSSIIVDKSVLRGMDSSVGLIESLLIPDEVSGDLNPVDMMSGGFGVIGELPTASKDALEQARKLTQAIEDESRGNVPVSRSLHSAGHSLAYVISVFNSLIHPEMVLLSGPLIESKVYCEAVLQKSAELVGQKFADSVIKFNRLSSCEAARSLAIHHFLAQDGFPWKASQLKVAA